jgi:hypothetical protein
MAVMRCGGCDEGVVRMVYLMGLLGGKWTTDSGREENSWIAGEGGFVYFAGEGGF